MSLSTMSEYMYVLWYHLMVATLALPLPMHVYFGSHSRLHMYTCACVAVIVSRFCSFVSMQLNCTYVFDDVVLACVISR